jgi:citrate synthase
MARTKRDGYLTAKEATALLGVKPETLYAYVSRGLLRSMTGSTPRERLYASEDLQVLLARRRARSGHGPAAAAALRWGEPVLESAITLIAPPEIYYRGYSLDALPPRFEDVAELLWNGNLAAEAVLWDSPSAPHLAQPSSRSGRKETIREQAHYLIRVTNQLALAEGEGEKRPFLDRARGLIRVLAAAAGGQRFSAALAAETAAESFLIGFGLSARRPLLNAVNRTFVVSADHELNPSTFAARIATSTGADLHAAVCAALATLSGPKHGGASQEIEAFLGGFEGVVGARSRVRRARQAGRPIPGFGNRPYPTGDPRARPLLQLAGEIAPQNPRIRKIGMLQECLGETAGLAPLLDLGLYAIASAVGLQPSAAFALFAVGRSAGWVAHILEQRQENSMLRPRARYVGRAPLASTPAPAPGSEI